MCEDCHQEYCCVHGRRTLRFWGLGGASYPRCAMGPSARSGSQPMLGHRTDGTLGRRELLEELRTTLTQRLRSLDAELRELGG